MQGLRRLPLPAGLRRLARTVRRRGGIPPQPGPAGRERNGERPTRPSRAAAREEELLATVANLVRHRGRLALVRDDLLPADARDANLRSLAEALEAASVPYGLVPDGRLTHRVAIAPGDRAAALKACAAAFAGLPVHARLITADGEAGDVLAEDLPAAVDAAEAVPGDGDRPAGEAPRPAHVRAVRLHHPVVTSGRTLTYGPETGCDLEFWEAPDSGEGAIATLRETPYGWWVPSLTASATHRVGDRDYPVVDYFSGRFPDDIDFPVDAVITWVDAADPAWRRRRDRAALAAATGRDSGVDLADNRYRDRGELRYCLRSIAAYAPWIRHVYLVTDDQVPAWLDTGHPRVTVVDHRELLTDPDAPEVFNSHAIESRLHRIPGLAEHFVYFNDDILLGRPQRPQDYFLPSGLPKVFHDRRAVDPGSRAGDDVFTSSQKVTRQAVEEAVGRTYPHTLAHTPYPLTRSLFTRVEELLPGRLEATARSVFRSTDDLAPVTLASHLALAQGHAVEGRLVHTYVSTAHHDVIEKLPPLAAERGHDAFCLADDEEAPTEAGDQTGDQTGDRAGLTATQQHNIVAAFLEAYFPVPSPFEHPQP
ncbi:MULTISPECIES: Stealth CR1 domain-containing protein [unclassified Streptomyces]|uniref:Stealth CR1 domain-containing protein n=1 Tax=unclassified Streptomyces TaxID=2593676 RepID=UPI00068D8417|nr:MULTISPECIES: stealth conserved region 3 domain-containing protein [unclassified Streptomyces]